MIRQFEMIYKVIMGKHSMTFTSTIYFIDKDHAMQQ